jgi:LysM repeat protein
MRITGAGGCVGGLAVFLSAGGGGDDGEAEDAPEPTPVPEATPEPEPEPQTYTVQSGDTLTAIAQRLDTTVDAIVEANVLENPDLIQPGQELIIPPPG